MKHYACCSFGKDSVASVLLALEHGEPLDGIVFCEVMFDHSRGISGEEPEHIQFVQETAIPYFERLGVKVHTLRAPVDYVGSFHHVISRGPRAGLLRGFPLCDRCAINRDCKVRPMRRFFRKITPPEGLVQYVGIAADEPRRLSRLDGTRKVSLLSKYGCTEFMARNLCARHGLMSPIYERGNRNGCWFCPNRSVASFALLRRHHPALWAEIERLSEVPGKVSEKFNRENTVPDLRRKMDAYDADCVDLLFKF